MTATGESDRAPRSAFWDFSLSFYAGPGIPDTCLELQDGCGADVNVLLYALFLARNGRMIEADDAARIEAVVGPWRDGVVRPLRGVRRLLKTPPESFADDASAALRGELKRLELESERLQQLALERQFPLTTTGRAHADVMACARRNLDCYAKGLNAFPAAAVETLVRRLCDI